MLVLLLIAAGVTKGYSQSTMGKDFWVSFLPNSDDESVNLSLIAAGSRACSGTIVNPRTNWSTNFNVSPGVTTNISIPKTQAYHFMGSDCILNTALHVVSTDSISLYASNFEQYTFDVTDVLPTQSLGSEYVIQTYDATFKGQSLVSKKGDGRDLEHDRSEFVIVAVEDGTVVTITLSCNSINGHYANQPFSVTLNAGQCYQLMATEYGNFSGSQITVANEKKVAVFAGNLCAYIPSGYGYADHIVEQMMPVTCWGQHFVITNSYLRTKDIVRVTALNNNCQIIRNGALIATINARQTYEFEITSTAKTAYLETSEPAMVFLYLTGSDYGGENGDPSMVIISPIEQRINYVTFSTFNSGVSQYHYVNIVTDADKVSGMRLDGNSISSNFQSVSGNSDYAYARVQVNHGSHTLYNPNGGFIAHVYGLGDCESYAYSVGSMAINLTSQMIVNDESASQHPDGFYICQGGTVNFDLNLNFIPSQTLWDFGDGQTGTNCPMSHSYASPGDYLVSCEIYNIEEGVELQVAVLTTVIHVGQPTQTDLTETHCISYTWYGTTYTESGDYEHIVQSMYGCDSLLVLHLNVYPSEVTHLNITACEEYEWHGNTYTQSGTYQYHEQTVHGCDSLVVLHLEIGENFSSEETVHSCYSYQWRGHTYTESGTYTEVVPNSMGCDSTFVLQLTIGGDVSSDTTAFACDDFEWYGQTYHESGEYTHLLHTWIGCDSLITLHLTMGDITQIEETVTECNSYEWRGHTYTMSGVYQEVVQSPASCDSILILNLTLGHDTFHDTTASACEPFLWYGNTYAESGNYTHLMQTPEGCDSLITLHLTIGSEQIHPVEVESTCEDDFNWHGYHYTQSGVYYDTLLGIAGCNDIYVLDLTFEDGYHFMVNEAACDRYPWPSAPGGYVTMSGHYLFEGETVGGCDSVVDLNLTVNHTPDLEIHGLTNVAISTDLWPGVYNYCVADSLELGSCTVTWSCSNPEWILMPTENPYWCKLIAKTLGLATLTAVATCNSGCDAEYTLEINASYFEVDEAVAGGVMLFPNPAQTQVTVQAYQLTGVRMYDSYGQEVKRLACDQEDEVTVEVGDLKPGIYLVEVMTTTGTTTKRLVINGF